MELKNKKLTNDEFYTIRKEILNHWPTGAEVDFEEAVAYHKQIPDSRQFAKVLLKAKKDKVTLK